MSETLRKDLAEHFLKQQVAGQHQCRQLWNVAEVFRKAFDSPIVIWVRAVLQEAKGALFDQGPSPAT
jgi:hypothetical protein